MRIAYRPLPGFFMSLSILGALTTTLVAQSLPSLLVYQTSAHSPTLTSARVIALPFSSIFVWSLVQ